MATSFGGLLSIVYRVIVYGFLLMKLKQMYYYADDLTNMLVDDILLDTIKELAVLEGKERTH